jgi:hypothetical protein
MSQRIEDRAMFGDCGTAGFVVLDGAIDSLCVPPSCFFTNPRAPRPDIGSAVSFVTLWPCRHC